MRRTALTLLALTSLPCFAAIPGGGPGHTALPTVTVGLRKAVAEEGASGAAGLGAFVLHRTGNTTSALTVSVAAGGTATPDADYEALKPTYTIPAGQDRITVVVKTYGDHEEEGEETVTLTVLPETGYVPGTPDARTVTITEPGTSFDPTKS